MITIDYKRSAIQPSDCISIAWELVKNRLGLYIGAGIVVMILVGMVPFVSVFLSGPVMGGFYYLVLKDLEGEPVDFGMLFKGFEKFLPLMLVGIITAIPGIIYQIFYYASSFVQLIQGSGTSDPNFFQAEPAPWPYSTGVTIVIVVFAIGYILFSILWSYVLNFAIPLIMEHGLGIGEAIKLSFGAAFSNLGGLFVLGLLGGLVVLLGFLAFCVGFLVAVPVVMASQVIAYRQVFPLDGGTYRRDQRNQGSIFGLDV